jgi:septal ring factor EnvC (AmiA/AmiB activator)
VIDYQLEVPDHCRRYERMTLAELTAEVRGLTKLHAKSDRDSKRLAEKCQALGFECSRARRTTASAKWSRAAEERDLFQLMLDAANEVIARRIDG